MNEAYSIGSKDWTGLSKLVEEAGELVQVAGKLLATSGKVEHWDGSNLADRLEEELADLSAAISFFISTNDHRLDVETIQHRMGDKLALYAEWHEQGNL